MAWKIKLCVSYVICVLGTWHRREKTVGEWCVGRSLRHIRMKAKFPKIDYYYIDNFEKEKIGIDIILSGTKSS